MEVATAEVAAATAFAISSVPFANAGISKTPIGPFQTIVFPLAISALYAAIVFCDVSATPADQMGLDIGPKTIAAYSAEIAKGKTIVWNRPIGGFEMPAFAKGTLEIAKAVAAATSAGAASIVGGRGSAAEGDQFAVAAKR